MNRLNQLLGTEFPIIQGGMANIATGEFAAACSNAGALGVIASGSLRSGEELRKQIEICRSKTDRPFGVNLMLMNPSAPEMAQVIAQERVPVVTTGAGNPAHYIPAWKEAGVKVFPVVAASILARRLVQAGADAIIAEGTESGGHVGEMTTMALVPQVVDAVNVPVIAAGGIFDRTDINHVLDLGVDGVQIASRFVATEECDASPAYKQAYIQAKEEDIAIIQSPVGMPGRALRNAFIRRVEETKDPIRKCYNCLKKCNPAEVPYCITKALIDAVQGDVDNGLIFCGANIGRIREMTTVHDLIKELIG